MTLTVEREADIRGRASLFTLKDDIPLLLAEIDRLRAAYQELERKFDQTSNILNGCKSYLDKWL